ncbi:HAD family hydrolase [Bacteroides sp. AN502(2024)]|uniref:HAD family hydrolase n=1 Tax=Bacteroides sp. AN502(2024) TaxID=3160599 RepID=UPI003519D5EC
MIKNIVFDFGGVIVDIDRDKAVQAFSKLGLADADTRLDKYHQTGIFQELEEGKLSADEFRKQLGDLCNRPLTMEETKQAWLGFFNEVNQNKLDYILELRKSYHVYILSNTNPFVMSWACSTDFSSRKKPLNDYCDKLYLSYQISHTKPEPEIFDYMVNDCNIIPSETLFVDDSASNIQIGKALGFETLQPENGEDWREKITAILKNEN